MSKTIKLTSSQEYSIDELKALIAEAEKPITKREDGSLVGSPIDGTKCVFILEDGGIFFACPKATGFSEARDLQLLEQGRVFLPEDIDLADKKASSMNTPKKRWRAEKGQDYYLVGEDGNINTYVDGHDRIDDFLYSTGNYFQTKEETEAYKYKLIINQRLADLALELNDGWVADWSDDDEEKWFLYYTHDKNSFRVMSNRKYQPLYTPVFQTYDKAQQALDTLLAEFGEERVKRALLN